MKIYLRNIPFLSLCLVALLVIGAVLLQYPKADIHLWMNANHNTAWDFLFRYYTVVGEWVPYVIVAALLFYKAGWAVFMLGDLLLSGLLAQRLKYVFDTDRPYLFFQNNYPDIQLPFVEGVRLSKFYSFPSGHTTTFFVFFFVLCLIATDRLASQRQQVSTPSAKSGYAWLMYVLVPSVCFIFALLGAYSRIYLSQHFLEDIFGGMILGVGTTLLLMWIIEKWGETRFWNWNLLDLRHKNRQKTKK